MRTSITVRAVLALTLSLALAPAARAADQCIECHRALDEEELAAPARGFSEDVHNREGLGCAACHGGDPTAEDPEEAMDPARGFRGAPERGEIPRFCGACHADASFIKRFDPNLPTDQWSQYRTSVHGRRVAQGDGNAAVCTSCHGVHGIRRVKDPRSPVYPTHVVDTCASCHGNAGLMKAYGIPANQPAEYRRSVHYAALTQKNDLSAPTCNDCHGAHGATPPGVASISNVCGTCHLQNMEMFQKSPHGEAFPAMELGACEACHGNHEIVRPDDSLVGVGPGTVCGQCHEADDPGGEAAAGIRAVLHEGSLEIQKARDAVERAARAGMLMEPAEVALEEAHQSLVQARARVHLASVSAVAELGNQAHDKATAALKAAERAFQEIRFRRRGLLVALGLIVLAGVGLVLKIRSLES